MPILLLSDEEVEAFLFKLKEFGRMFVDYISTKGGKEAQKFIEEYLNANEAECNTFFNAFFSEVAPSGTMELALYVLGCIVWISPRNIFPDLDGTPEKIEWVDRTTPKFMRLLLAALEVNDAHLMSLEEIVSFRNACCTMSTLYAEHSNELSRSNTPEFVD